ncbi:MAG: hypothetical protein IJ447_07305 [Clostridia bacterium]|nr:hypothetical protein [Clostridia bacterium]
MYDIHCHILPNVDDGSGSINDSIEMAIIAADSGIKGIVATPHCNIPGICDNYWNPEFDEKISILNQKLKKRSIPVKIYRGQEVFAHGDILMHLKNGTLITLNNSVYVLTEFDFRTSEHDVYPVLQRLVSEGYKPVVAHPERYAFTYDNPDSINRMRQIGSFIQLNGDSIKGEFGRYPKRVSKFILENRLADFVASDAHSQYRRTPNLTSAHEMVCENYSFDYANLIFNENPCKVINNKEIR